MHKVALYSQKLNNETDILKIYLEAVHKGLISQPLLFSDDSSIILNASQLHTYNLLSQNLLVMTDNTIFNIVDIYNSNKFICIDDKSRYDYSKVDFYPKENFVQEEERLKQLQEIFAKEEYKKYEIQ